jgi:mono/diheme cytochrome c family protein
MRPANIRVLGGVLLSGIAVVFLAAALRPAPAPPDAEAAARGEYLVSIMGCNDCHTPFKMGPQGPEPDMSRMLSGHPAELVMPPAPQLPEGPWLWLGAATNTAFAGPWGVSYAFNLTPDKKTGLGTWTPEAFARAVREGWHLGVEGSRRVLPPMPWPIYSNLTDEDVQAIFAYLQTIPPIENVVPASVPVVPGTK